MEIETKAKLILLIKLILIFMVFVIAAWELQGWI